MNLNEIKEKASVVDNSKKIIDFFYWKMSWVLILILLMLSGYCVLVWYQYVYHPHWDAARVQEYEKTKSDGTNFDKLDFQAVVDEKKARADDYQKTFDDSGDIFRLKVAAKTNTK